MFHVSGVNRHGDEDRTAAQPKNRGAHCWARWATSSPHADSVTSIEQTVAAAQVTMGTLDRHFKDKRDPIAGGFRADRRRARTAPGGVMRARMLAGILALSLAAVACGGGSPAGSAGGDRSSPTSDGPSPASRSLPAASGPDADAQPGAGRRQGSLGPREAWLYFLVAGADQRFLTPERHSVSRGARPREVMRALVANEPDDPDHVRPFPAASRVRSVTVADGMATVDWGAEVLPTRARTRRPSPSPSRPRPGR